MGQPAFDQAVGIGHLETRRRAWHRVGAPCSPSAPSSSGRPGPAPRPQRRQRVGAIWPAGRWEAGSSLVTFLHLDLDPDLVRDLAGGRKHPRPSSPKTGAGDEVTRRKSRPRTHRWSSFPTTHGTGTRWPPIVAFHGPGDVRRPSRAVVEGAVHPAPSSRCRWTHENGEGRGRAMSMQAVAIVSCRGARHRARRGQLHRVGADRVRRGFMAMGLGNPGSAASCWCHSDGRRGQDRRPTSVVGEDGDLTVILLVGTLHRRRHQVVVPLRLRIGEDDVERGSSPAWADSLPHAMNA